MPRKHGKCAILEPGLWSGLPTSLGFTEKGGGFEEERNAADCVDNVCSGDAVTAATITGFVYWGSISFQGLHCT